MISFTEKQYDDLLWFISHSLYAPFDYDEKKRVYFEAVREIQGYPHWVRLYWLTYLRDTGKVSIPESIKEQIDEAIQTKQSLVFAGPRQNAIVV